MSAAAHTRSRRPLSVQLLDLLVLVVLLGLGVLGFGPVFGGVGYLIAGLGGLVIGLGIALLGARQRWGLLTVAAATLVGYFLFGGALALPSTTFFGVLPGLDTVRELATGIVFSWKQLLTVEAPVAGFDTLLIVPFLAALLAAVFAGSFALRLSRPVFALLPVLALFVVSIGFGTHEVLLPVVRGIILAVVAIAWLAWRLAAARASSALATAVGSPQDDSTSRVQARNRRLALGAGLLVLALGVGVVTGDAVSPASARQVLRDTVVPPLDLRAYPSPLVAFRKYVRDYKDKTLFTVTGLPDGARVRLATLDRYDGIVYNVAGDGSAGSGTFSRVGSAIAETQTGTPATIGVTVDALTGVWVPDTGSLTSLQFTGDRAAQLAESLHYNRSTGVAVSTLGLQPGDSYTAQVIIPTVPTDEAIGTRQAANLAMPASSSVPDAVNTASDAAIGEETTALAQVRAIESTLHSTGFVSHGLEGETPSRAGHGSERIASLLTAKQLVGDDEQYAVAMALEVSHLGMPARVVMGFYPKDATTGSVAITGSDVHAWVEVAFDGLGWVTFDPTPPADQIPQAEVPKSKAQPQAQVLQPALAPVKPVDLPPALLPDEQPDSQSSDLGALLLLIAGIVGGALALFVVLFGPAIVIGILKARRRRRRIRAERPIDRLSNGWSEIVDTATDLGVPTTVGATRREGSRALEERYPDAGVTVLADRVDSGVFGPTDPTDRQLDEFWTEVDRIVATMTGSVGRWARLRARLSLRSFWNGWMLRATTFTQKRRNTL